MGFSDPYRLFSWRKKSLSPPYQLFSEPYQVFSGFKNRRFAA